MLPDALGEYQLAAWRNGAVLVTLGKTAAARHSIPMTPRVRFILEARWEFAEKPAYGWVWPAPTECAHVNHASLKKQHARAFREANAEIKAKAEKEKSKVALLRPWVLYSFRHTFLTRLGESGCDAWTLARIAGHSSIAISSRYVHPSEDAVLNAMAKLGGHKIGHSAETKEITADSEQLQLAENADGLLARPERFELPTYCSGGNRSIQLSYGRACPKYTSGRPAWLEHAAPNRSLFPVVHSHSLF